METPIYGSVATGFENVAAAEVRARLGVKCASNRGNIRFSIDKTRLLEISELRTVDNLFGVLYEFAVEGLDTLSNEDALDLIREEVVKVNWADAVDCWQRAKDNRSISGGISKIKTVMKSFVENGTVQPVTETSPSFRVTCKRGGAKEAHKFSSMDAARVFGAQLNNIFGWRPDMKNFDMEIILNIIKDKMLIMIALNEESLYKRNVIAFGPTTLRSSICYSMVALASPEPNDKLLDPLCGGGSIPIEGALAFPGTHWTGVDNHEKALERCAENYNHNKDNFGLSTIEFVNMDATSLSFANDYFNAIVTDMPFGKKIGSIADNRILYPQFLKEWERVVIPGGKAVILTKDKRTIENVMKSQLTAWRMLSSTMVNVGGLEVMCAVLLNKK